ncbi:MAG: hypothetical protein JWM81_874 [Candidatus Saccharibacteria bacterium]|nr:hypothetical protein [Candidatus Saccharibacteria bacterium]
MPLLQEMLILPSYSHRMEALVGYYQKLDALDPTSPGHHAQADRINFVSGYDLATDVLDPITLLKDNVRRHIGINARIQYTNGGLERKDIRKDTGKQRTERADLMAMITAPVEKGERQSRAARIASFLGHVADGATLLIPDFSVDTSLYQTRKVTISGNGPLLAQFDSHVASTVLNLHDGRPLRGSGGEEFFSDGILCTVPLPLLFQENGVSIVTPLAA